ncbi:oxidoreductase [Salinibacterium sp. SYSU T00001]|uniref:acrylyl-CoA reductase (NADPH) n=1 Tax=Homoserinimonas sedimenticola TaxID=2986805 RepID=UPI002235EFA8|nr:MDR family oxidoreductase [Salinibacterium sedimenticola]MCW4385851.1 oxidoreductase [Salinibacterium sedimenticola]
MRALRVEKNDDGISTRLITDLGDDDLMAGDVTIDVEYSSINFKDGLAIMGRPGVIRDYPLIPGIDLVGTVASADASSRWSAGDRVLLNGQGLGETHHGGLAERARVKSDWLVRVPDALSSRQAAAIGTAGFTAMLAVLALERAGALDHSDGSVLVTGAAGGVGSVAITLLSRLGHHVTASTGRPEESDYLQSLGADAIIDRAELSEPGKPLQGQRWAAAVDSVGGATLANVLAQTSYGGTVASCGLAQSAELPTTVMPFILRAVNLAGINSVFAPTVLREQAWDRLASDLDLELLDSLTETVGLADAPAVAERILQGGVRGRTVVDVRN